MPKPIKTPLAIAAGSTLALALAPATIQAETSLSLGENPFTITDLSYGYMQTAKSDDKSKSKMKEAACGEGQCGSAMMKGSEEKTAEGNCAGNKPIPKTKPSDKKMEGKCGEGKCGSSMQKSK